MEHDLLQSQIRENCRLTLPEGLKELMSDISRELPLLLGSKVLRAQPRDLYSFISNYLSVLMVTRDHLTVAAQLYSGVVTSDACDRELKHELERTGLDDETVEELRKIITEYLESDERKEANLLQKLVNTTDLQENQLTAVKNAVQNAFKRHLSYNTTIYESSESDTDETEKAVKHTLHLYRKTNVSDAQYAQTSDRVKASYRAYGVQRCEPSEGSADSFSSSIKIYKNSLNLGKENEEVLDNQEEKTEKESSNIDYLNIQYNQSNFEVRKKISFKNAFHDHADVDAA